MSIKGYLIGGMFLIIVYLMIVSSAVKWATDMSKQTEQNFADAIRTMQGK